MKSPRPLRPLTCRQALASLLRALHMQHANSTQGIYQQVNIAMLDAYKALGSVQKDRHISKKPMVKK